jgi:hypothetical protein
MDVQIQACRICFEEQARPPPACQRAGKAEMYDARGQFNASTPQLTSDETMRCECRGATTRSVVSRTDYRESIAKDER